MTWDTVLPCVSVDSEISGCAFQKLCQAIIFIFHVAMHLKLSMNKEERKKGN